MALKPQVQFRSTRSVALAVCLSVILIQVTSSFQALPSAVKSHHGPQVLNHISALHLNGDSSDSFENLFNKLTQNANVVSIPNLPIPPPLPAVTTETLVEDTSSLVRDTSSLLSSQLTTLLALPIITKVSLFLPPVLLIILYLSTPPPNYRDGFEPYPRGQYDPLVAKAYYSRHPFLVLRRSLELLRISASFILKLFVDNKITKSEEKNRSKRAEELLSIIQKIGPSAIKLGQALSVRPDIIPSEYASTLSTLQDRVPPFALSEAKRILGRSELLGSLSLENTPVASASIGQVYKTTLPDGRVVAIKIQRPDGLSSIALDLHVVREYFVPLYGLVTRSATDYVSLANEWGRGFVAELDYLSESRNTVKFNEEMKKRGLYDVVRAPVVVEEFSSETVLTTEWVEGKRLDESYEEGDVTRLCGVALNAYLVMLLEIGTLHCDPHPGNLLRMTDGKLCILDFGMTIDTDPNLQYELLEFVAHLTSRDYDRVPEDLVGLGFLKEERLETVKASGFLAPLTFILKQASEGGGGQKVRERIFDEAREKYPGLEDDELRVVMREDMRDSIKKAQKEASTISGITIEVEELQKNNKDAFRIPEWFLYTSRAFLTLEGICLQADEEYSLIQSCFPYVAGRLLKDGDERVQQALRDLLYGAGGTMVDVDRLTEVADGFSTYTTSTKSKSQTTQTETAITLAKDSADILLSSKPNILQNLLLEESTAVATGSLKSTLKRILVDNRRDIRDRLPFLPGKGVEDRISVFLEKSDEEKQALDLLNRLNERGSNINSDVASDIGDAAQDLDAEEVALVVKELRENLPKYAPLIGQLGGKFASTLLQKTSRDINAQLEKIEAETSGAHDDENLENALVTKLAKGVATVAGQGANAINQQREKEKVM